MVLVVDVMVHNQRVVNLQYVETQRNILLLICVLSLLKSFQLCYQL